MKNIARQKFRRHSRGIGIMTALIATSFVTIAILTCGYLFSAQMRRTRDLPHANQHRQLLIAASDALLTRLNASQKPEPLALFTLPLPPELGETKVTCEPDPAAANTYTIAATSHGFSTRQTTTVGRENGRYRLISATLSPDNH